MTVREVRLGAAEVHDTFKISKIGTIAGCNDIRPDDVMEFFTTEKLKGTLE